MTRAYAYLRVSGNGQVEGTGFDRQLASCQRLATQQGLAIAQVFREEAVSGTKDSDERPAYLAMLREAAESGIQIILVEHLDRLARYFRVQEQMLCGLVELGFTLYAANTGENVTEAIQADPMRKALVQVQGIFAELDRSQIVLKLKKGRQITREQNGRCEGTKPFGENPKKPAEAMVLGRILTLGGHGHSAAYIAEHLNQTRFPSRSGRPWSGPVVARILRRHRLAA